MGLETVVRRGPASPAPFQLIDCSLQHVSFELLFGTSSFGKAARSKYDSADIDAQDVQTLSSPTT